MNFEDLAANRALDTIKAYKHIGTGHIGFISLYEMLCEWSMVCHLSPTLENVSCSSQVGSYIERPATEAASTVADPLTG
jgi:hypothetical protein